MAWILPHVFEGNKGANAVVGRKYTFLSLDICTLHYISWFNTGAYI